MARISPVALLLLCGCYVNVPLATAPAPGTELSVALTDRGSVDLAQYLGRGVASVNGRLIQSDDSAVSVSVSQTVTQSGDDQLWKGESVTIPRVAIASVQRRKLSYWRSGIISGAVAVAAFLIGSQAGGSSGSGKGGGPPPVGQ